MTTPAEIAAWFDRGVAKGATHLVVTTDTFDYSDFPVYVMPGQDAREVYEKERNKPMQKVMEVYVLDLARKEAQLKEFRAFNF